MTHRVHPLGTNIEAGPPKESHRLEDGPGYVLASITLRNGALVPTHVAKEALIITCVAGQGELTIDDGRETVPLTPGTVATIEPGVRHGLRTPSELRVVLVRVHPAPS